MLQQVTGAGANRQAFGVRIYVSLSRSHAVLMLVVTIGVRSLRFYVLVHISLLGFGLPRVPFLRGSLSLASNYDSPLFNCSPDGVMVCMRNREHSITFQ